MSYDLIVFDPKTAPHSAAAFLSWYNEQAALEDSQYNDVERTTPELRAWYREIISAYPPMNGPDASDDFDNPRLTDYAIGKFAVCAAFAWSEAQAAYETMFHLAKQHGVGFFNISSDEAQPFFPSSDR